MKATAWKTRNDIPSGRMICKPWNRRVAAHGPTQSVIVFEEEIDVLENTQGSETDGDDGDAQQQPAR